jgi:hypothetical protein
MTCKELLKQFTEALERDEVDWGLFRRLVNKCGRSFGAEALKAFAKKTVYMAVARAWALYRGDEFKSGVKVLCWLGWLAMDEGSREVLGTYAKLNLPHMVARTLSNNKRRLPSLNCLRSWAYPSMWSTNPLRGSGARRRGAPTRAS